MFTIFRYIEAIAPSPWPVLITGETGTGKELIAQALHRLSRRPDELVAVNVAGLDDTCRPPTSSPTLFGHTKGSFTGAAGPREGLITQAAEGTLFLDEIGDLTTASQVKLLRLLQDGSYYPLGADHPRQNRSRVIVATHCDVVQRVNEGAFRKDLYYRLRTHHLQLPPLRARPEDLPLLVNYFLENAANALGKPVPTVPLALYQLLRTYSFPGNVRELEALVLDAVTRHQGRTLSLQSFKDAIAASAYLAQSETPPEAAPAALLFPAPLPTLDETEAALIAEALRRAEGNQGRGRRDAGPLAAGPEQTAQPLELSASPGNEGVLRGATSVAPPRVSGISLLARFSSRPRRSSLILSTYVAGVKPQPNGTLHLLSH